MSRTRFITPLLALGATLLITACEESPTQPDGEPEVVAWTSALSVSETGNGAPSGAHYNLNIIGKKDGFTCPEQEYDEFGDPIYGNVVFVPEDGEGIQILMESGRFFSCPRTKQATTSTPEPWRPRQTIPI